MRSCVKTVINRFYRNRIPRRRRKRKVIIYHLTLSLYLRCSLSRVMLAEANLQVTHYSHEDPSRAKENIHLIGTQKRELIIRSSNLIAEMH